MRLNKNAKNLLNCIYKKYVEVHGCNISEIDSFSVVIMDDGFRSALPDLFEGDPDLTELKAVIRDLRARGYVKSNTPYRDVFLTIDGYKMSSKSVFGKTLDFLNSNPGLAIPISLLSLGIALIAFIKSW